MEENSLREQTIQDIQEEIKLYCDKDVWSIEWMTVQSWLSNFNSDPEHWYFAHLLLDKIVFRSNKMLEASYRRFFATTVRHKINEISGNTFSIEEFLSALKNGDRRIITLFRICFVDTGEAAESGSSLLRHLNSDLINPMFNLNNESGKREYQKLSDTYLILVVDDFLGSGEQAINFFTQSAPLLPSSDYLMDRDKLIFAPTLAMTDGIRTFKERVPDIALLPLEEVLIEQGLFEGDLDTAFGGRDPKFTKAQAKKCCLDIKKNHNIGLDDWLGRDNSGLSIVFQLGVPNQSLAIIFHKEDNWNTLNNRRSS